MRRCDIVAAIVLLIFCSQTSPFSRPSGWSIEESSPIPLSTADMRAKLCTATAAIPLIQQALARLLSEEALLGPIEGLNLTFSPARPPSIPLAVRSPYASIWSSTAGGNSINSKHVTFWNGADVGWEGAIIVDGVGYEYLGAAFRNMPENLRRNLHSAIPSSVLYDTSSSVFTLTAGPVEVKASFLSPVLPNDLCRTSVPLSYLNTSWTSLDGHPHHVKLYADVSSTMLTQDDDDVTGILSDYRKDSSINSHMRPSTLLAWQFSRLTPLVYGESSEFARWGSVVHATSAGNASELEYQSGGSLAVRTSYLLNHSLSNTEGSTVRGDINDDAVFAFSHSFGSAKSGSALYTIGSVQDPIIQYTSSAGLAGLHPWWTQCYNGSYDMIPAHYDEYHEALKNSSEWDSTLRADIDAYYSSSQVVVKRNVNDTSSTMSGTDQFGTPYTFDPDNAYGWLNTSDPELPAIAVPFASESDNYYAILALSARQVMGAYVLTGRVDLPNETEESSEPMFFQKEISSNGNVNTVDVMFPAMPFFLYANPMLLKWGKFKQITEALQKVLYTNHLQIHVLTWESKVLDPLFLYQESNYYPNAHSIHDIGSHFPNATGHLDGADERMTVEECGNMIIMAYAVFKFMNDSSEGTEYLRQHFTSLERWAGFLEENALIPESQLSTDDFAGHLVNQTDLAIKGIIALKAMANICELVGNKGCHSWRETADENYLQWETMAIDPTGRHTQLSYQHRSSWGTLYNTYPDKLLDLGVVSQRIHDLQSAWYPHVSQVFGVPLDSRSMQTKSDWEMWAAATCQPSTRRLFVNSLVYWLNNTEFNVPFSDRFQTTGYGGRPEGAEFMARPVVGGHFSFLALSKAEEFGEIPLQVV
ncbi:hypothetical protein AC579_8671 [Pseudocercospora musae]|uniref:Glutaminase n=1 Tax=Pseudocercospora musae TaxID=113226 RepID=A0A139I427_9PEZI|nr:hypothetical protein AC579_8671 [Pseudocercospora musae]